PRRQRRRGAVGLLPARLAAAPAPAGGPHRARPEPALAAAPRALSRGRRDPAAAHRHRRLPRARARAGRRGRRGGRTTWRGLAAARRDAAEQRPVSRAARWGGVLVVAGG